ncbi:serine hydrolase domain-containing protein [Leifsonia naganoensis]|uniref:CubicO group peptidase (Beta-lactamase class C family) n=1 Tax=Leifsonia naganoensis TaxID=150025 RepID=A0A853DU94_9MICO|nr:serine hydrolase domain-containing protein [Leifsonia naganoensis]NYK11273.1 CubicO group peptidase (beta-lactamase class C family) [Leifsonia naganoensis]
MGARGPGIVSALQAFVDAGEIAGAAVRLTERGETLVDAAVGWADLDLRTPVTERSLFQQASLTKPVVAVALVQLVEEGLVRLDDPVARFIPSFASTTAFAGADARTVVAAERLITLRDLLTHSSGLGHGPASQPLIEAIRTDDQTLAERVDAYARIPGDVQPGVDAGYSPAVGFDVLGRVIEVVTGADLEGALRARLLDPLGMVDTTFVPDPEQAARTVRRYTRADGALQPDDEAARPMLSTPAGLHSGAAGLFGTLHDFDRFGRMLAAGGELDGVRVLSPESVLSLSASRGTGARSSGPGLEWGLGVIVETQGDEVRAKGSWGWSGAWGTHLVVDPADRSALVLMVNRSDIGGAGSPVSREISRLARRRD